jgi:hypothetical protein
VGKAKRAHHLSSGVELHGGHAPPHGDTLPTLHLHIRHCERSEAIQCEEESLDCFGALRLAMTEFGAAN